MLIAEGIHPIKKPEEFIKDIREIDIEVWKLFFYAPRLLCPTPIECVMVVVVVRRGGGVAVWERIVF